MVGLSSITMCGKDSPDLSETKVCYPEGSTRIEAVSWDGTRTLVYGKNDIGFNKIQKDYNRTTRYRLPNPDT